jgi:hypothetical protein
MSLADPRELVLRIYDEELGLRLTNFSIKPVHVANGLARALTQRSYATKALAQTLRRWVRKQKLGIDKEQYPNDVILRDFGEAFEPRRGTTPNEQQLNRLRALAKDAIGADDAVFPQEDQSSYTLANERFVTKDPSDVRVGLFLARLLRAEPESRTDAADLFVELLASESDAWTTLALPLLTLGQVREEMLDGEVGQLAAKSDHLFQATDGQLASPTLAVLREACDRLARFERESGSKLNSLRRLVLFGCFAVHVHAISRWHERNDAAPRPPILLDMFDGTLKSVRDASRATVRASGDAIEGLLLECLREWVRTEIGTSREDIDSALRSESGNEALIPDCETYLAGGQPPLDAIAQTLIDAAMDDPKMREHPIGALVELGRRAGFLTPWANTGRGGKLQKRYTATAEFLETLVAATVSPDDPLEFPEFLDRLRFDYGIVLGRPEDDRLIRYNNLHGTQFGPPTAINEEELRQNVMQFRALVVETGYAKSYADGRTVITTAPEGALL